MVSELRVPLDPKELEPAENLAGQHKTTVTALVQAYVRYLASGGMPVEVVGDGISAEDLFRLSMASGAFDWLADEPDIYTLDDGEPV